MYIKLQVTISGGATQALLDGLLPVAYPGMYRYFQG